MLNVSLHRHHSEIHLRQQQYLVCGKTWRRIFASAASSFQVASTVFHLLVIRILTWRTVDASQSGECVSMGKLHRNQTHRYPVKWWNSLFYVDFSLAYIVLFQHVRSKINWMVIFSDDPTIWDGLANFKIIELFHAFSLRYQLSKLNFWR